MNRNPNRQPSARAARRRALVLVFACATLARAGVAQTQIPETPSPPGAEAAATAQSPAVDPNAAASPAVDPNAPVTPLPPPFAPELAAEAAPEPPRQLARDMSVFGMFMDAGLVAKAVMILLILASIWNVSILLEKSLTLRSVNQNADRFLETFRRSKSLEELSKQTQAKAQGPMPEMFVAGMSEFHLSVSSGLAATGDLRDRMRARIQDAMEISRTHATHELGKYMSLLATVGATAPFIGLFGTVWGIMTSFIGIAQTQTTNLAVVAPGIAEALLATAIGLGAAIPAVMLYNKFSRDIGRFSGRLQSFENEFAIALSRQLDMKG